MQREVHNSPGNISPVFVLTPMPYIMGQLVSPLNIVFTSPMHACVKSISNGCLWKDSNLRRKIGFDENHLMASYPITPIFIFKFSIPFKDKCALIKLSQSPDISLFYLLNPLFFRSYYRGRVILIWAIFFLLKNYSSLAFLNPFDKFLKGHFWEFTEDSSSSPPLINSLKNCFF